MASRGSQYTIKIFPNRSHGVRLGDTDTPRGHAHAVYNTRLKPLPNRHCGERELFAALGFNRTSLRQMSDSCLTAADCDERGLFVALGLFRTSLRQMSDSCLAAADCVIINL